MKRFGLLVLAAITALGCEEIPTESPSNQPISVNHRANVAGGPSGGGTLLATTNQI